MIASCTPARQYWYASHSCVIVSLLGKAEQEDILERLLFQAVAQVNPTALNTFLLLTALCSFLASGFIPFSPPLLQAACRLLSVLFLFQKLCALSASYRLFLRSFISFSFIHISGFQKLRSSQLHTVDTKILSQLYFA